MAAIGGADLPTSLQLSTSLPRLYTRPMNDDGAFICLELYAMDKDDGVLVVACKVLKDCPHHDLVSGE